MNTSSSSCFPLMCSQHIPGTFPSSSSTPASTVYVLNKEKVLSVNKSFVYSPVYRVPVNGLPISSVSSQYGDYYNTPLNGMISSQPRMSTGFENHQSPSASNGCKSRVTASDSIISQNFQSSITNINNTNMNQGALPSIATFCSNSPSSLRAMENTSLSCSSVPQPCLNSADTGSGFLELNMAPETGTVNICDPAAVGQFTGDTQSNIQSTIQPDPVQQTYPGQNCNVLTVQGQCLTETKDSMSLTAPYTQHSADQQTVLVYGDSQSIHFQQANSNMNTNNVVAAAASLSGISSSDVIPANSSEIQDNHLQEQLIQGSGYDLQDFSVSDTCMTQILNMSNTNLFDKFLDQFEGEDSDMSISKFNSPYKPKDGSIKRYAKILPKEKVNLTDGKMDIIFPTTEQIDEYGTEESVSTFPVNYCSCSQEERGEEVPFEQVFIRDGQMYRLPDAHILKMGNFEIYSFEKDNNFFVSVQLFYRCIGSQLRKMYEREISHSDDSETLVIGENEFELLKQKCRLFQVKLSKGLIAMTSIVRISRKLLLICSDRLVKSLASGLCYKKILGSNVKCSNCGLTLQKEEVPEQFERLQIVIEEETISPSTLPSSSPSSSTVPASIGDILFDRYRMLGFKMKENLYLSLKVLIHLSIFTLDILKERLARIDVKPIRAPAEVEANISSNKKTLWIDMTALRCICCMSKTNMKKPQLVHALSCGKYEYHETIFIPSVEDTTLEKTVHNIDSETLEIQETDARQPFGIVRTKGRTETKDLNFMPKAKVVFTSAGQNTFQENISKKSSNHNKVDDTVSSTTKDGLMLREGRKKVNVTGEPESSLFKPHGKRKILCRKESEVQGTKDGSENGNTVLQESSRFVSANCQPSARYIIVDKSESMPVTPELVKTGLRLTDPKTESRSKPLSNFTVFVEEKPGCHAKQSTKLPKTSVQGKGSVSRLPPGLYIVSNMAEFQKKMATSSEKNISSVPESNDMTVSDGSMVVMNTASVIHSDVENENIVLGSQGNQIEIVQNNASTPPRPLVDGPEILTTSDNTIQITKVTPQSVQLDSGNVEQVADVAGTALPSDTADNEATEIKEILAEEGILLEDDPPQDGGLVDENETQEITEQLTTLKDTCEQQDEKGDLKTVDSICEADSSDEQASASQIDLPECAAEDSCNTAVDMPVQSGDSNNNEQCKSLEQAVISNQNSECNTSRENVSVLNIEDCSKDVQMETASPVVSGLMGNLSSPRVEKLCSKLQNFTQPEESLQMLAVIAEAVDEEGSTEREAAQPSLEQFTVARISAVRKELKKLDIDFDALPEEKQCHVLLLIERQADELLNKVKQHVNFTRCQGKDKAFDIVLSLKPSAKQAFPELFTPDNDSKCKEFAVTLSRYMALRFWQQQGVTGSRSQCEEQEEPACSLDNTQASGTSSSNNENTDMTTSLTESAESSTSQISPCNTSRSRKRSGAKELASVAKRKKSN